MPHYLRQPRRSKPAGSKTTKASLLPTTQNTPNQVPTGGETPPAATAAYAEVVKATTSNHFKQLDAKIAALNQLNTQVQANRTDIENLLQRVGNMLTEFQ